ncbi:uncharacterized protein LOC143069125 [Mytilus galloprovincialis]|uniref:uncharacterized protein LOC143069125 n=1 Tax=Mytilus galloprovincialis TaxID=29158 RepID=UPI003F7BD4B8
MGATSSKNGHSNKGKVLQQQPVQPPQPPYNGIPCDYQFLRIDIPFTIQMNLSFLSNPNMQMATSDPNAYVPHLTQMYEIGYRLLSFQLTPGSIQSSGFMTMSSTTTLRAQAIFRKNEPKFKPDERFSLQVIKSSIESGTFLTGVHSMSHTSSQTQTQTQHLYQMINDYACRGCRLRCIEITGCYKPPQDLNMYGPQTMGVGSGMAYGQGHLHSRSRIYGVDLFFEIPQHPSPELYQYQAVPLKLTAQLNVSMGFGTPNQNWGLQLDWQGVMNQYLGTGWRLIEVFNDMSADTSSGMTGFGSSSTTSVLNIIFIFEKSQSRLNDNTPMYEGTMVEYQAPGSVSAGIGTSTMVIDTNWDNVIENMGNQGWELITILQTPATTTKMQFMGASMTSLMWMFFQRQIVSASLPPIGFDPPAPVLPYKQ